MSRRVVTCISLMFLLGSLPVWADDATDAREAAEAWLALHDKGEYAQTWETASTIIQESVPRDKWEALMRSAAEPLGKLKSRTLSSTQALGEVPGMPPGKYVLLQYDAVYENKSAAVESLIPVLEGGTWKVMTYRIQ